MSNAIATCVDSDVWSFNSLRQSPCEVATELASICVNDFRLPPLEDGFVYLGPTPSVANPCRCNSVYYSVLSACSECQNREWVRWSRYSFNCTDVYLTMFPHPIPAGVAVPHWAYLNVTTDDNFNVTRARAAVGEESSAPPIPVPSGPIDNGGGNDNNNDPGNGNGNGNGNVDKKKTNVGAIAGGVVGGVVFLALVGLLVFFLLRRRKQKQIPPSSLYSQQTGGQMSTFSAAPTAYASTAPRVYDPNDPSTWPTQQDALRTGTPPAAFQQNNYIPVPQNATGQSGTTYANHPASGYSTQPNYAPMQPHQQQVPQQPMPTGGRYTGVPEL